VEVARLSLAGFRDPQRRPRYVIWTSVSVLLLAGFVVVMLAATSTRGFCANPICHKVQADTINAYQASAHANISCIACHEPLNADPLTLVLAKAKSMLELIPTFGNTYELPLNAGSALALTGGREMGSQLCKQCHGGHRKVTTSDGIIIDHAAHDEAGIWCTVCHNRVAHRDGLAEPMLVDPKGNKNARHADFMKMDYCFRCHDLEGKVKMTGPKAQSAPGQCSAFHPADFELVPETHDAAEWKRGGHAEAALEAFREVGAGEAEARILEAEGVQAHLAAPVNSCFTCHVESRFCKPCHAKLVVPKKS
jgi:hypothetical protein